MFLAAHQQGAMMNQMQGQNQPGFFGSMLGGLMGRIADTSGLQYKILNKSKLETTD